jgi:hypothetical protein
MRFAVFGDQKKDGFHGLEAGLAARLSFGGLYSALMPWSCTTPCAFSA